MRDKLIELLLTPLPIMVDGCTVGERRLSTSQATRLADILIDNKEVLTALLTKELDIPNLLTRDEVLTGIKCCNNPSGSCDGCPVENEELCKDILNESAHYYNIK